MLRASGQVDPEVLDTAEYFVTVHLGDLEPGLVAVPPAPRAATVAEVANEVSPLLARLDADVRAQLFGRREIRVSRPTLATDRLRPSSVAARRSGPEYPLVRMRILIEGVEEVFSDSLLRQASTADRPSYTKRHSDR